MVLRKSILLLVLSIISVLNARAQKGITGLINAEKQFAWFTASHTVKEGFLKFMDSAGVIFRNGSDVNALEAYRKQPANTGILSWSPAFAVISASGDIGATTGPFEFRAKTAQDTPVGRGNFFSIWRIDARGEWKNVADLGSSYQAAFTPGAEVKEIVLPKAKITAAREEELLALDNNFNVALQEKNIGGWMRYISTDSWFNLDGRVPATGMLQIADALNIMPAGLKLSTKKAVLASSNNFAYTYGTVVNGNKTNNYLRSWIYRNRQWQVIIQTLKW